MWLEKTCKKCGLEIILPGDVATFYPGKKFCECEDIIYCDDR